MLLLITDTSGKNGSVALVRAKDGPDEIQLIEAVPLVGGTFSAQLVPQISGLLEKHGLKKTEIGAFIVVSGPGSFTGLRIGLAAIKALAEILHKLIVPVSLLEVVALAAGKHEGHVLAALDAGRGEVYAGEYRMQSESAELIREQLIHKQELAAIARDMHISTPDAAIAEFIRSLGLRVCAVQTVTAQMIASLGWSKLRAGQTVPPDQLEANYIRRSDAEIFGKTGS